MTAAPSQPSDLELVGRVAKGDRAAVRLLFMRHHARIFRFVARQTGSESMADDIANEVFLELWKQAPGFEGRSQVSTWLLGIARFKALSHLRKRKEEWIDDDDAAAVPDTADTPEVSVMKDNKATCAARHGQCPAGGAAHGYRSCLLSREIGERDRRDTVDPGCNGENQNVLRPQETRRGAAGIRVRQGMAMSEPEYMSRRDELETLLPFYLNGTLDGADLAAVEEWLASDPYRGCGAGRG